MTALLDTHVLLWMLDDSKRLGEGARRWLDGQPRVHVSVASLWELSIKRDLGKLHAPENLPELIEGSGVEWLPIEPRHVWGIGAIVGLPHRDPFDRLLLAQAHQERLTLLTADAILLAAALEPQVRMHDASR